MRKLWIAALLLTTPAWAQDRPTNGVLSNTQEMSSLTFDCRSPSSDALECDVVQTSVWRGANEKDLPEALAKARRQWKENPVGFKSQDCAGIKEVIATLKGTGSELAPDAKAQFDKMSSKEKASLLAWMSPVSDFCDRPSEASVVKLAQASHEKSVRTCRASSNSYKQTFKRVSGSNTWTANEGPKGICGVVDVSKFEPAKDNKLFWTYTTKKVVTNKSGQLFPGMECRMLDEAEYLYDWKAKEWFAQCDYIKFSP